MKVSSNILRGDLKSSRRPLFELLGELLTADEVINNDELDGEGIELG